MFRLVISNKFRIGITIFLVTILFGVLYKLYIPRINAFGCFDDCFNIVGGYFILGGKEIYKDLFFNHQPGMAFLSAAIQMFTHPESIPELILRHRQIILLISFIATLTITIRFGIFFIFFSILYELTKFYVFGDRFLAEGIVGYFLIYQFGATLEKIIYKRANKIDLVLIPFLTWAVIFLREPFTLVTLLLFVTYFFTSPRLTRKNGRIYLLSLIIPSAITILSINLPGYFFNMITVNKVILDSEAQGQPLIVRVLKSLFYPIYLIISNEGWNYFRTITSSLSVLFIIAATIYTRLSKQILVAPFVIVVLAISNLRPPVANQTFYESFHIAPWYALLIFSIIFLVKIIYLKSKKIALSFAVVILLFGVYIISDLSYFGYEKIDLHNEFFTNYSTVMGRGTIIRNLSNSKSTLFLDDYDDLVFFEAKLKPSYKYSWYTSFMNRVPKYVEAREEMFLKYPPDFYYGDCKGGQGVLPSYIKNEYLEVFEGENTTCIHVSRKRIENFTAKQKELTSTIYSLRESTKAATLE